MRPGGHRPVRRGRTLLAACIALALAAGLLATNAQRAASATTEESPLPPLEPGEVVTDRTDRTALLPLEEGPSTKRAATCDSAESRKARSIVQEVLLSQLPAEFVLPPTCPFHPSLDLLRLEEASKKKIARTMWKCTTCGRTFSSQHHVDAHIQHRHMQHAGSNSVCLADYCDILDCRHRTARFDPLTGEQLLSGVTEGGLYGSAAARAHNKQQRRGATEKQAGAAAADRLAIPGATSVDELRKQRAAQPLVHPHDDRCQPAKMELARLKCQTTLLQCFHDEDGGSSSEVHALYDRFRSDICEGLRCTPDGLHANAALIAGQREAESRGRLYTIGAFLVLFVLAIFYFLAYNMRVEFGWRAASARGGPATATAGRAYTSSLLGRAKERTWLDQAQHWLGMQQKKRTTPSKII